MDGGYGSETGLVTVGEGGGFVKAVCKVGQSLCRQSTNCRFVSVLRPLLVVPM